MRIQLGPGLPGCDALASCSEFAAPLLAQLGGGGYTFPVSLLELSDADAHLASHRTARKRAARCRRLGYVFAPLEREHHADEIHAINTSLAVRQGRPMSAGYLERPAFLPLPEYECGRHAIRTYGVTSPAGVLVAYLVLYMSGDLVMVSQILGHADHLANDVMYLLVVAAFGVVPVPSVVFYNRHDSGMDGLRYFKERLGFRAGRAKWAL